MNHKTIDAIRYLVLKYKKRVLKKYLQYIEELSPKSEEQFKLIKLVENGEAAIIPIGFRCFTANMIKNKLGITQTSLPFNSGFFSPDAVASVLENPQINLEFNDDGQTHTVCIKNELNTDPKYGFGIKFSTSTYEEIDSIVTSRYIDSINKYLDSSFGYYTLDKKHKFVLAHYNWHPFADKSEPNGITSPCDNLPKINDILNKRIVRMLEMCDKAKHIFFIFGEGQNYKYMQIDNKYYMLNNFSKLNDICSKKFGSKFSIVNINDVKDLSEFLNKFTLK